MNFITLIKLFTFALIFNLISHKSFCQSINSKIEQDPKIESLLKEKRKINSGITINDKYKIQIFVGKSEDCKKKLDEFKTYFKEIDGTIVYNNPNFKVWVGSFKTRIDAEKASLEIKKKYPTALLIKPNK